MRTMYDAVTAANITKANPNPQMVAGYVDRIKLAPWSAADWARFPRAVKVRIVKKASTNDGHVLDVEPGDATPAEAPGWVRMRRAAGADPTVYCNSSTWPAVRAAFTSQRVAQPHYWIAQYDGKPKWADGWAQLGCVAKQYAGNVSPGIDLSSVADYWPGVDPAPTQEDLPMDQNTFNAMFATAMFNTRDEGSNLYDRYKQLRDQIEAARAQLAALQPNVSADEVAAKLLPALTTAVTAAVAGLDVSELDKISDEDAAKIAKAVTDHAAALLKPAA